MSVVIAILAILCAAAITLLLTANRRGALRGSLSRETRRRDLGAAETAVAPAAADDSTAAARERADETMAALEGGGLPEAGEEAPPAPTTWVPVDEEELGVTRRQFLNRGVVASVSFGLASFGASIIAFLWPVAGGGFGGKVKAGKLADIVSQINDKKAPFYVPEARSYLVTYPDDRVEAAKKAGYKPAVVKSIEQGVLALYQKCPHLGCRVPWCQSSQWFECPCHASKYNAVGEKRDGPAPRGMSHWPVTVSGGLVTIDTSGAAIDGLPIGTDTTGQKPEGPPCV